MGSCVRQRWVHGFFSGSAEGVAERRSTRGGGGVVPQLGTHGSDFGWTSDGSRRRSHPHGRRFSRPARGAAATDRGVARRRGGGRRGQAEPPGAAKGPSQALSFVLPRPWHSLGLSDPAQRGHLQPYGSQGRRFGQFHGREEPLSPWSSGVGGL